VPADQVLTAYGVMQARHAEPFEHAQDDDDGRGHGEWIGITDDGFRRVEDAAAVEKLMSVLGGVEREALRLRFAEDLTQSDIAARMGVSQMQVSRVVRRATAKLNAVAGAAALR
jgi:RNA polymerase sigma-B factor